MKKIKGQLKSLDELLIVILKKIIYTVNPLKENWIYSCYYKEF
jgi:hypothetical protein